MPLNIDGVPRPAADGDAMVDWALAVEADLVELNTTSGEPLIDHSSEIKQVITRTLGADTIQFTIWLDPFENPYRIIGKRNGVKEYGATIKYDHLGHFVAFDED